MTQACHIGTTTVVLVASIMTSGSAAFAQSQTAHSFQQLQVLVAVGDSVKVIDRDGNRVAGRITAISDARLILNVQGTPKTVDEADVSEIRRRSGDSLANGAWAGFGVGAGIGTLGLASWCATEACSGPALMIIPIYGALGAGIGVGIDALIRGERALYRAPGSLGMSLTPMFGTRRGIGLSVSF